MSPCALQRLSRDFGMFQIFDGILESFKTIDNKKIFIVVFQSWHYRENTLRKKKLISNYFGGRRELRPTIGPEVRQISFVLLYLRPTIGPEV